MLTKTITYTDYNGVERTENFLFNLTKAELMEREMASSGGLENILQEIIDSKDQEKITEAFKQIILRSYGEKSDDGKRFVKVKDGHRLSEDFAQTEAYSELFMELSTDADKAAAFVNGIIPKEIAAAAAKESASALPNNTNN
jgi:hypothetical protein